MAWTVIAVKNPGDPVRAIDYNATNDNFAALANGDSGAPRIYQPAFAAPIAGTTYQQKWLGDRSHSVTSGFPAANLTVDSETNIVLAHVLVSGAVTVRYTFDNTGSTANGYVRIMKNGVSQHTHTGSTLVTNSPTITVAKGDTLTLQSYNDGGTLELTDVTVRTANNVLAIA